MLDTPVCTEVNLYLNVGQTSQILDADPIMVEPGASVTIVCDWDPYNTAFYDYRVAIYQ